MPGPKKPIPKPKAAPNPKKPSEEDIYFADLQKRMKGRFETTPVSPFAPRVDPAEEKRKKREAAKTKAVGKATDTKLGGKRRGRGKAIDSMIDNF